MKKIIEATFLGLILILGCGCFEIETVISLNYDGSGTITEKFVISKNVEEMTKQFLPGALKESGSEDTREEKELDRRYYEERAANFGRDVRLVSVEQGNNDGGGHFIRTVYAFPDITKVKISQAPEAPIPEDAGTRIEEPAGEKPVTFQFNKGKVCQLKVLFPLPQKPEILNEETMSAPSEKDLENLPPQQLEIMKQIFSELKMKVSIEVPGTMVKTNATFVEKQPAVSGTPSMENKTKDPTGSNTAIVLLDMDFAELLKSDDAMAILAQFSDIKDMDAARKKLKNIPGIKLESKREVSIEFKKK